MPSFKTQLRLNQVQSGSATSIRPSAIVKGVNAASHECGDLSGSLEYIAQAISNIHGIVEFGAQEPGAFTHARVSVTGSSLAFNQAAEIEAAVGALTLDGTTGINLQENGTTVFSIDNDRDVDVANARNSDQSYTGTYKVDSAGAPSHIKHTGGADGDFTIAMDGDANASLILSSTGTGGDALQVSTSAGGMDITVAGAAAGQDLDISANSSVNISSSENVADAIVLNASNGGLDILATGAPDEDIDISNTAGSVNISAGESAQDAIKIESTAGGVDILASGAAPGEDIDITATGSSVNITSTEGELDAVVINANNAAGGIELKVNSNQVVGIDATTVDVAQDIKMAADLFHFTADALSFVSGAAIDITTTKANTGNITIKATSSGIQLSGSQGIGLSGSLAISADKTGFTNLNGTAQEGKMLFAAHSDFPTFRSKPLFGASTTVIGALNALADAAGGGVVGKMELSASVDSPDVFSLSSMDNSTGYVEIIDLTEANPANTDVFLNGQLLTSGSSLGTNADYVIFGHARPGVLKFAFDLQPDDVLVVKTTSQQQ